MQIYGARPLRRWLERKVVTHLSKMLINNEIDENSTVYIDAKAMGEETASGELSYRVDKNGGILKAKEKGGAPVGLLEVSEESLPMKKVKYINDEDGVEEEGEHMAED